MLTNLGITYSNGEYFTSTRFEIYQQYRSSEGDIRNIIDYLSILSKLKQLSFLIFDLSKGRQYLSFYDNNKIDFFSFWHNTRKTLNTIF